MFSVFLLLTTQGHCLNSNLDDMANHGHAMPTPQRAILVLALTPGNTYTVGCTTTSTAIVGDADKARLALTRTHTSR